MFLVNFVCPCLKLFDLIGTQQQGVRHVNRELILWAMWRDSEGVKIG